MKKKNSIVVFVIIFLLPLIIFAQDTTKVYKVNATKCIGCTICVRSGGCPTDAIEMKNGKAVIDSRKCIGCGICAKKCPFGAIYEVEIMDSTEQADEEIVPEVTDSTEVKQSVYVIDADACIGCKICVRKCPVGAITMKDGKAVIDSTKCISCGICAQKCPVKAIHKTNEKK
ncbi:MAG TPA: 4Fe-4S dicluster domain-containing protein [Candidatus Cloacimonetes bacterium]|nr:4Fe-4S dicluster domain-containing protein [Candidatus Cloacimonadota bacterium]